MVTVQHQKLTTTQITKTYPLSSIVASNNIILKRAGQYAVIDNYGKLFKHSHIDSVEFSRIWPSTNKLHSHAAAAAAL